MAGPTLESAFRRLDVNNQGSLSADELRSAILHAQFRAGTFPVLSDGFAPQLVDAWDSSKDGKIDRAEFDKGMVMLFGQWHGDDQIVSGALRAFDFADQHTGMEHGTPDGAVEFMNHEVVDLGRLLGAQNWEDAYGFGTAFTNLLDENDDRKLNRAEMEAFAQDVKLAWDKEFPPR